MALVKFLKQVFQEFGKDKVGQLSAAFAYGAIFSIGPLLLVLISVIGFVYGDQATQGKLYSELVGSVGPDGAKTIQNVIAHTHQAGKGGLALIAGILGMLVAAVGITTQLQNSFNAILGVVPDPKGGIKRTVLVKLKNILLVLFAGMTVTASLIASSVIVGLGQKAHQSLGVPAFALEIINTLVSVLIFMVVLYLLYRVLPDLVLPRKIVLATSAAVVLLFIIGKIILGIIIGNNGTAGVYGAAASLITLLLWIYYSGQILLLGAEGMKVYGFNNGLGYAPKKLNLKRTTIHVDSRGFRGRLIESWVRGYRKRANK